MELLLIIGLFLIVVYIGGIFGTYKLLKKCIKEAIIEARLK